MTTRHLLRTGMARAWRSLPSDESPVEVVVARLVVLAVVAVTVLAVWALAFAVSLLVKG